MEVVKQTRTYVLGTEIDFGGEAVTLDEVLLTLSTTATVGNRQLVLTKVERLQAAFNILNELKAKFQSNTVNLVEKLNTDAGVTDENYSSGAALVAATTLATAYTLANALKARLNTVTTKLDADAGVASTNYAAAAAVASADATTRASLMTLTKELYTDWDQILCMLDADTGVVDQNYRTTLALTSPALPTQTTKNASAVTVASQVVAHRFSEAVSDGNGTGYVNTNFSSAFTISAVQALTITDSNSTDAADGVELQIQASR